MELYIGGFGQDKLKTVLDSKKDSFRSRAGGSETETAAEGAGSGEKGSQADVFYGEDVLNSRVFQCRIINHFHLILKKLPSGDIPLFLEELYEKNPEVIIICDEVGNGIVPVDREERQYRETVGKSCQWLAARSRRVVRIICGCMQVIREEEPRGERR